MPHCFGGNGNGCEEMESAAERAAKLRVGCALLAGRGMMGLFIMLRLLFQRMAQRVCGSVLLREQQGEGKQ